MNNELLAALLRHCGLPTHGTPQELLSNTLRAFSRIPYENLTKIIAHAESSDKHWKQSPVELVHGFIRNGTGGTCFPLTACLLHLIRSLGYEAGAILANRRYGSDTHCAVIIRLGRGPWYLIDPGYMIFSPCQLPLAEDNSMGSLTLRYNLPHGAIELSPTTDPMRIELYTLRSSEQRRYRLTYKVNPIDETEFNSAWDRSFSWDMMRYPVLSVVSGSEHIYLQKNNLLIRSAHDSNRATLTTEQLILELAPRLGIESSVLQRALQLVR
jgi:arylamine N-acetyltransferase